MRSSLFLVEEWGAIEFDQHDLLNSSSEQSLERNTEEREELFVVGEEEVRLGVVVVVVRQSRGCCCWGCCLRTQTMMTDRRIPCSLAISTMTMMPCRR